ncbi:MAG TPA: type II toxin-antitoxin system VapC family toxin [Verrucomicrobiales bacterium]|nr:type II toxin-antitoxin system VapC family toxin [Verrucomicrobiales bacterium]
MSWLVDTNIFSEPVKRKADPKVVSWLRDHEPELYVSTITIGELRRGIERLPAGKRKTQLHAWLQSLCDCMKGRVLSFNTSTAHVWGQLKAKWDKAGLNVPSLDSQIAATAQRHHLTLVTRNTSDFYLTGIKLHNPFSAA